MLPSFSLERQGGGMESADNFGAGHFNKVRLAAWWKSETTVI
jgi:hypothetical protein